MGLEYLDISNPMNPTQIWQYDTYLPNNHSSYRGCWGVYPYLPSGNYSIRYAKWTFTLSNVLTLI